MKLYNFLLKKNVKIKYIEFVEKKYILLVNYQLEYNFIINNLFIEKNLTNDFEIDDK